MPQSSDESAAGVGASTSATSGNKLTYDWKKLLGEHKHHDTDQQRARWLDTNFFQKITVPAAQQRYATSIAKILVEERGQQKAKRLGRLFLFFQDLDDGLIEKAMANAFNPNLLFRLTQSGVSDILQRLEFVEQTIKPLSPDFSDEWNKNLLVINKLLQVTIIIYAQADNISSIGNLWRFIKGLLDYRFQQDTYNIPEEDILFVLECIQFRLQHNESFDDIQKSPTSSLENIYQALTTLSRSTYMLDGLRAPERQIPREEQVNLTGKLRNIKAQELIRAEIRKFSNNVRFDNGSEKNATANFEYACILLLGTYPENAADLDYELLILDILNHFALQLRLQPFIEALLESDYAPHQKLGLHLAGRIARRFYIDHFVKHYPEAQDHLGNFTNPLFAAETNILHFQTLATCLQGLPREVKWINGLVCRYYQRHLQENKPKAFVHYLNFLAQITQDAALSQLEQFFSVMLEIRLPDLTPVEYVSDLTAGGCEFFAGPERTIQVLHCCITASSDVAVILNERYMIANSLKESGLRYLNQKFSDDREFCERFVAYQGGLDVILEKNWDKIKNAAANIKLSWVRSMAANIVCIMEGTQAFLAYAPTLSETREDPESQPLLGLPTSMLRGSALIQQLIKFILNSIHSAEKTAKRNISTQHSTYDASLHDFISYVSTHMNCTPSEAVNHLRKPLINAVIAQAKPLIQMKNTLKDHEAEINYFLKHFANEVIKQENEHQQYCGRCQGTVRRTAFSWYISFAFIAGFIGGNILINLLSIFRVLDLDDTIAIDVPLALGALGLFGTAGGLGIRAYQHHRFARSIATVGEPAPILLQIEPSQSR